MEGLRLSFLSDKAAELFAAGYEIVIGCDADEYIVVEPRLGMNLAGCFRPGAEALMPYPPVCERRNIKIWEHRHKEVYL